jgi:hypothetical protein
MSQLSHPLVETHRLRVVADEVLEAAYEAAKANSLKQTAAALDDMFGADGRPVSESLLRAALRQGERNYPRLEWAALLVTLPDSRVLPLLADAAGYALTPKKPITDAEFRTIVERELPRVCGTMGAEFLERLQGRGTK